MKPYFQTSSVILYNSDCLTALNALPDGSIQTCVTSPPYYGLRDYGTATWEGGADDCDHVANPKATKKFGNDEFNENRPSREATATAGYFAPVCPKCGAVRVDHQIGLEDTPEAYVNRLVEVFREVRRVLRDDGTLWLNLGDSYASGQGGNIGKTSVFASPKGSRQRSEAKLLINGGGRAPVAEGLKPKDLIGIPWRVAFALQSDGWWLRQDIIWAKPNPMPESVTDRCTKAHEYIFLLSKSARYFYDSGAVMEQGSLTSHGGRLQKYVNDSKRKIKSLQCTKSSTLCGKASDYSLNNTRNRRSVWSVATKPYSGAHFAVFPPELITPCILAGAPLGGTVLDPFAGSGTTLQTAKDLGRKAIGIELNPDYCPLIVERCQQLTIFDSELAHV